ncbi:MFS transporter [Vagococcus coleopterorum]|uniref:MFS transporter n=1 Tax=Vagococcus coleopterorum TaxID=2714946 RepID=A0A6G8ANC8_9ENTE|nr:MFS transporter [Vagococcus coleopterorum]QIL46578.1 MFS transporter [Vagococcus coleopterorum]
MSEKISKQQFLLVLGIIFIATNLRAPITAVGPLISHISDTYQLSSSVAGMIATTPLLAFAGASILAPRSAARFGIERTLFFFLIVLGAGIIVRSLPGIFSLFFGTVMIGIGIAHGNVLVPSLIKRDFPDNLGLMTGIYSVAMNVAGAIASGLSLPLVESFGLTWQGSLRVWVIFTVIALLFWFPQLKNQTLAKVEETRSSDVNLLKSRLAWQVSWFMGLQSLYFYSLLAWMPEIFSEKAISGETSGWLLALMQLFIVPLNFIVAIIAGRRRDQRSLVVIGSALLFLGLFGIMFSSNVWIIGLSVAAIGAGGGFSFSLAMMFFSVRTTSSHDAGRISGMAQAIGYLLAACGPFVFGFLHDMTNTWMSSLIFLFFVTVALLVIGLQAGRDRLIK